MGRRETTLALIVEKMPTTGHTTGLTPTSSSAQTTAVGTRSNQITINLGADPVTGNTTRRFVKCESQGVMQMSKKLKLGELFAGY